MLKKTLLLLLSVFLMHTTLLADPEDCMSRAEAEALLVQLKKERYITDYCDCCASFDSGVTANLLLIKKMSIVPCEYDAERFSVKMETQLLGSFGIKDNTYTDRQPHQGNSMEFALLNYQFFLRKGQPQQLGFLLRNDYEAPNCSGLAAFPSAALVNNKKYAAWLKKKK